ncbi:hypothetical protein ACIBI9_64140 [Nonomuraea sp. NPDC050451]|uniref:hypothetical protein n=1 Tax=Nonomuraea sp. NPDC050451 TaxID=3364364 RepID=UPI0037A5C7B5
MAKYTVGKCCRELPGGSRPAFLNRTTGPIQASSPRHKRAGLLRLARDESAERAFGVIAPPIKLEQQEVSPNADRREPGKLMLAS